MIDGPCIDHGLSGNKPEGYHQIRINGKLQYVHRVAYAQHHEKALETVGLVRHLCNNPRCVNPNHLAEGTHQDNADDRVKANRSAKAIPARRKLTTEQSVVIATRYQNRKTHYCKTDGVVALAKEFNVSTQAIYGSTKRTQGSHD